MTPRPFRLAARVPRDGGTRRESAGAHPKPEPASGPLQQAAAQWEGIPTDQAWRLEPYLTPAQAKHLFTALSALPTRYSVYDHPSVCENRVWVQMAPFVQGAVRNHGARAGDLADWARAGLVRAARSGFHLTDGWSSWRTLAVVNPGCGWDFAVAAAAAGYSLQQASTTFKEGTITLGELQFLVALADSQH